MIDQPLASACWNDCADGIGFSGSVSRAAEQPIAANTAAATTTQRSTCIGLPLRSIVIPRRKKRKVPERPGSHLNTRERTRPVTARLEAPARRKSRRIMSFEAFRALHHRERVLFLPNVWDAASAALFAQAGAEAIATTSAAVAWARGYADGGALPREELVSALRSVCRAAGELPVSADIEHGYSDDPARVASLVVELTEIGVAGINLEDGGGPPDLLAAKIVAVKRAVRAKNRDVFVNARADVYLRGLAEGDAAIRETIARAMIYERAGADGFYPIAVTDTKAISEIAHATKLALNVLADRSLPAP